MAEVEAEATVLGSLAEVWELYFDRERWRGWVEGFGSVEASQGYPEQGGTLRWRSIPSGRGTVTERVLSHEPRTLHRIAFADEHSEGELETRFAIASEAEGESRTRVAQKMSYRLLTPGMFGPLTDRLFVRGQVRRSLERTLAALAAEARTSG